MQAPCGVGVPLTTAEQMQVLRMLSVAFMVARLNVQNWWEAEQVAVGFIQGLSRQGLDVVRVAGESW